MCSLSTSDTKIMVTVTGSLRRTRPRMVKLRLDTNVSEKQEFTSSLFPTTVQRHLVLSVTKKSVTAQSLDTAESYYATRDTVRASVVSRVHPALIQLFVTCKKTCTASVT